MLGFAAVPVKPVSKSRAKGENGNASGYKDDPIRSAVLLGPDPGPSSEGGADAPFLRYLEGTRLALGL